MPKPRKTACRLRARKTRFVEILRTTPTNTVCPNFYVLAHANGCLFAPRCSYCYLKASLWFLQDEVAFTNVDDLLRQVREWIGRDGLESCVLNAGNLSDSLCFEEVRPLIRALVEMFRVEAEQRGRPHALLLVTKGGTDHCRTLLEHRPCRNVIVSFSVNSRRAARAHEKGAAAVEDRLAAARRLKRAGWRVRMRIDPMILGFDYAWIIDQVRRLAPERLTLGSLRAECNLPRYVRNGILAELQPPDEPKGLARYPSRQRLALYRPAVRALRDVCPVGLCEETPDIWDALGLETSAKCCNCGQ